MVDVFVVIPCFNEGDHVFDVVSSVREQGFSNIVLVDDGSSDCSSSRGVEAGALVLRHEVNLGKGSAVKTGCDFAISRGADVIVLMDCDGQHEASDIKRFLKALRTCDIVFGFRAFDKNMPFTMRFGNKFLTLVSKFLFGVGIKDTQNGFRCFDASIYDKIRWFSRDYGMESEMIARVARHNLSYGEVKIRTIYHDSHKGTTPLDGFKVLFNMLRFRFFE